jgi:ribose transport system ATP-binding protein
MRHGIATIYQELDLADGLTVAENIYLGHEQSRLGFTQRSRMHEAARQLMRRLGHPEIPVTREVGELSSAGKQLVSMARALSHDTRLIIMDEPSAVLAHDEVDNLFRIIGDLTAAGVAVVYISHRMEEIRRIGDRVTVLKDGRVVATHERADVSLDRLAEEMVGRSATSFFTKERVPVGDTVLGVENLSGPGVETATFDVRAGEVLGLGGMVGSGRTELVEMLFGARRRRAGRMEIRGREVSPRTPAQAIRTGIVMLTEDRSGTGLLAKRSLRENLAVARNERNGFLLAGERRVANEMVRSLRIVTSGIDQEVSFLSGGNQQKALLGRWLAVDGDVFLLDEPTKGVDIGAKQDIYGLIEELARHGKAIVLVSSDLPELLSLSDRVAVMRDGALVCIVDAANASEQSLAKEYVGV